MKRTTLACLCLAMLPAFAAHASLDSHVAAGKATPLTVPVAAPEAQAPGTDATAPVRRSRMVEAGPEDAPKMRFSALYRVVGKDPGGKDNCLKNTGSRLKRDDSGLGSCVRGNGRVYIPER